MKFLYLYILLVFALFLLPGCSGGSSVDVNGGEENGKEEINGEYDPNIPDDYRPWAGFEHRDFWGPYNLHDPGCLPDGEWTWCYSTDASYGNAAMESGRYIQVRRSRSQDLVNWEFYGWAFDAIPEEALQYVTEQNDGTQPAGIWAPFIMKTGDIYRLYYSVSVFASNASYIGLATSSSPEGPWQQQGAVVTTNQGNAINAIDPTVVVDSNTGRYWLAYGSHWTGIYILELDPATGKPLARGDQGSLIASSAMPFNAIEAPEIIYHEPSSMFYLFVSYGNLMDEYSIRVGRAESPEGPYYDIHGNDMTWNTNDFPILTSPYRFHTHPGWKGLGHNTVFETDGQWFSMQQGRLGGGGTNEHLMVMHLRKIFWTEDGWPVFSAQRYANVPQDEIREEDLVGEWEEILLTPLTGNAMNPAATIELNSDGTIEGKNAGWTLESGNLLRIHDIDTNREHELILSREWDWERSNLTIVYTGLDENGISVWGKKVP